MKNSTSETHNLFSFITDMKRPECVHLQRKSEGHKRCDSRLTWIVGLWGVFKAFLYFLNFYNEHVLFFNQTKAYFRREKSNGRFLSYVETSKYFNLYLLKRPSLWLLVCLIL